MNSKELKKFENRVKKLWNQGKIRGPVHLCDGNEEQLISIFKQIKREDYVFSTHRNHFHYLLHGGDKELLLWEILKRKDGLCKGNAGSMGTIDHSRRFYASAIVGGMCAPAVGVAWAIKNITKSKEKVWCFLGDGALDGGHFWSSFQYACGWDLPITFIIEDNDRSTCTNKADRLGDCSIRDKMLHNSNKIILYKYKPINPHVGSGKYVQF